MTDFTERVSDWMLGLWGRLKSCRAGLVWHAAHGFVWHTEGFQPLCLQPFSRTERAEHCSLRTMPICLWENDGVHVFLLLLLMISFQVWWSCGHCDQKITASVLRAVAYDRATQMLLCLVIFRRNEGRHIYSLAASRQCLCCCREMCEVRFLMYCWNGRNVNERKLQWQAIHAHLSSEVCE